jgi:glycosyltransferase involved in cell wall biosynthesis
MVSKACVVGMYQRKLEELARCPDMDLVVAVPPYWREGERLIHLERQFTSGYELAVLPMALNGHFHLHFYPGLGRLLGRVRPDLLHMDEEPYNLATSHGLLLAKQRKIPSMFFTWQNLSRRYPFPFSALENYSLSNASCAIAGNQDAAINLRSKGYEGSVHVIPQFGVDPNLYCRQREPRPDGTVVIGYLGRMVREKGVQILLEAVVGMPGPWHLCLVGDGDYLPELQRLTTQLGLEPRVEYRASVPSRDMPRLLNQLDVLVLPSLTQPNWKEQFGRVLVEAMACEVAVVGSSCGEIPHLIGDSGVVFPEGDADALRDALLRLISDERSRTALGHRGRDRVLEHYTQERVAKETCAAYQQCLNKTGESLAPM